MAKKAEKTVEAVYEEETEKKIDKAEKKTAKKPEKKVEEVKEETIVEEEKEVETPIRGGMSEMTRGLIIGIVLTALVAMVVILLILARNGNEPKASEDSLYEQFEEYMKKSDETLIVFAQTTCGFCQLQHPIIERIDELYDIDYLFLNYDQLATTDEKNAVVQTLGVEGGTPDSFVVKNGKVLTHHEGLLEGKDYVSFLVSAGILPTGSTYQDEERLEEIDFTKMKEIMKSKETAVILFDYYVQLGDAALTERKTINDLAKDMKVKVYHMTPGSFETKEEDAEFRKKLGEWGYSNEQYDKDQTSVMIPLLMIVKDGKIIWHQDGSLNADDIKSEFQKANLMK